MIADNKEQRVGMKFCFLLGKSAAETLLMPQESLQTATTQWHLKKHLHIPIVHDLPPSFTIVITCLYIIFNTIHEQNGGKKCCP